ncbi:MAG: hypothetical protein QM702_20820 [Rubrivivax sp.]
MSPSARHPVAFDRNATFLVTSEGTLVLVHDGGSEAPMFVHRMPADVVALAADATHVTAIDAEGNVHVFDAKDSLAREHRTGTPAFGGTAARGRTVVVGESVTLFDASGARTEIDVSGATCAALSDGTTLLVGTEDGALHAFDATNGKKLAKAELPGPAYGAAWSPRGHFVVTTKGGLGKVSADMTRVDPLCGTGDFQIGDVACSVDGLFAACRVSDGRVIVFDVAKNVPVAMITYERETGGVAFGPSGWLAVALDLGDGNKIDLDTGAVHRTDPHEGRTRNRWVLLADVKTDKVAAARGKASARVGSPISAPPAPIAPKGRGGAIVALGVAIAVVLVIFYLARA